MEKRSKIDLAKQGNGVSNLPNMETPPNNQQRNKIDGQNLQSWQDEIDVICRKLSVLSDAFDEHTTKATYELIEKYISKHDRWLYSSISAHLFACNDIIVGAFISNLDALRDYAFLKLSHCPQGNNGEKRKLQKVADAIVKLWDHANLAQTQNKSLHDSDDAFKARFDKNLIPFKSEFTHEMNMQFISLIAIFTALSFLVFGGISSLDNLFTDVGGVPILELMIVGCIWSLCISNLVFVFIYFVAKLTKLNIKTSNIEGATLGQMYPFYVWSNFFLILILVICCWLYFVDYADAGSWIIRFSQNNGCLTTVGGTVLIGVVFGWFAKCIINPSKRNKEQTTNEHKE